MYSKKSREDYNKKQEDLEVMLEQAGVKEFKASIPDHKKVIPMYISVPMSGISGCIAWMFTHPFELMKNRVILSGRTDLQLIYRELTKVEGPKGLFTGLSAGISRQVVYTSARLSLYEPMRNMVHMDKSRPPNVFERTVAGAASGACAAFFSSPVEVALVMLTKGGPGGAKRSSLFSAMRHINETNGIAGFWNGAVPLMTRAAIVGVSQVAFFDQCKTTIAPFFGEGDWGQNALNMTSSVITGVFYSTVTMPVEQARVRMSAQTGLKREFTSMGQAMRLIAHTTGYKSLYFGFVPYTLRCCMHTIVTFMVLETSKRQVKKFL